MEKPKPNKKRKTIRITYPAPYSQSWTPDVQPVLMKNNIVGSTRSKRPPYPRAWSQEFPPDRPDPTAPHLKYGVFRNRRGAAPKPLTKMDTCPKMHRLQRVPSPVKRIKSKTRQTSKHPQGVISRSSFTVAPMKPVENFSVLPEFPPKFVFRNPEKSYSRELSFSKVSHLDIKPKIITASVSPSFCPTPNFRSLSRRLTLTPTKYRGHEQVTKV